MPAAEVLSATCFRQVPRYDEKRPATFQDPSEIAGPWLRCGQVRDIVWRTLRDCIRSIHRRQLGRSSCSQRKRSDDTDNSSPNIASSGFNESGSSNVSEVRRINLYASRIFNVRASKPNRLSSVFASLHRLGRYILIGERATR